MTTLETVANRVAAVTNEPAELRARVARCPPPNGANSLS
jgi:hypothetical protein